MYFLASVVYLFHFRIIFSIGFFFYFFLIDNDKYLVGVTRDGLFLVIADDDFLNQSFFAPPKKMK